MYCYRINTLSRSQGICLVRLCSSPGDTLREQSGKLFSTYAGEVGARCKRENRVGI